MSFDERNRMLAELDVAAARKIVGGGDDHVLLMALHKARYECLAIDESLRHESARWLADRGLRRMTGGPLLPPGTLPEEGD